MVNNKHEVYTTVIIKTSENDSTIGSMEMKIMKQDTIEDLKVKTAKKLNALFPEKIQSLSFGKTSVFPEDLTLLIRNKKFKDDKLVKDLIPKSIGCLHCLLYLK
jgi:hypothetical protein